MANNTQVPQNIVDQWNEIGNKIKTERITDNSGNQLVAPGAYNPATNLISARDLNTVPKIDLTGTQAPMSTLDTFIAGTKSNISQFDTDYQRFLDLSAKTASETSAMDRLLSNLTDAEQGLTGRGATQLSTEEQLGINNLTKQRAETTQPKLKTALAEYEVLKAEFEKQKADIEAGAGSKGLTTGAVMGQQGAVDRAKLARLNSKASEIGLIEAEDLALKGQIEEAQKRADRAVDLLFQDRESQYATKLNQYNRIKDSLTAEESKRGKALEYALAQEKAKIDEEKQEKKAIQNIALEVAKNGITDQNVLSSISKAKNIDEAIIAASSYLRTPSTDIVKLDNGNTILIDKNTGKIIKSYGGSSTSGGSSGTNNVFGSLVNTTAGLETTVAGKKSISDQMNTYLKNEDYESAYNQIANTVENSLTGETKTKFANARIDREVLSGLKDSIVAYQTAGGNMNLLKGTSEEIVRKLGEVTDPKYTELAVQMQREFQTYRNAMTGAAFGPKESREYESVNPSSKKSLDLNISVINGALNQLNNRVDGTIKAKVPQSSDLKKIIEVPKTAEAAKSAVNAVWQGYPELQPTIEKLFSSGKYDDFTVLEYLKTKGLIK